MPGPKGFYIGLMFDRAAARHGRAPVFLDRPLDLAPGEGTRLTVGRLAALVRETAGRLISAGVLPGDHVAVYKCDNFDIALLAAAVQRVGAVPALLSPQLEGAVAARLLGRLERPWLVTDGRKLALAGFSPSAARQVLVVAGQPPAAGRALGGLAVASLGGVRVPGVHEPAFISHTSGTTGVPKLVVQSPDALWQRLRLQKLVAAATWRRETVALCVSFVHARFYSALDLGLSHGRPLLVAVDGSPQSIGPLFAEHRPGAVETQPNVYIDWEELAGYDGRPLSSVRYFSATFDAMHPRTVQTLLNASARRRPAFIQLYGQSETGPVTGTWYRRRDLDRLDGRRVGRGLPGVTRLRIVGEDGVPVAAGTTGHIEVSSRTRALTYLGEDPRFRANLNGRWWRMGDMGFKDSLGRVHLLDREIDRVEDLDSGLRLEDDLMERLPELREVVIVAGADGVAVPVVCTRGDAALDAARWRRATAGMPALGPVRQLPFDQVPRTSTWKVRRPELIALLEAGDAAGLPRAGAPARTAPAR
ncbi:class I adenylate-forming enzyme family protein [Streptacidiphilus albus]|uniref:class I adenylate-forming enzyme family protein n=1 Tax=Streptacidiphilus albus TaxID=105425 RepID=UPI00054C334C|nr:class I adenylate-forming enzyme family protein [Streptacidiphilus albus]